MAWIGTGVVLWKYSGLGSQGEVLGFAGGLLQGQQARQGGVGGWYLCTVECEQTRN